MINLLKELNDCKNAEELENYLSIHIDNVYDNFLNNDFIVINSFKSNIDKYLSRIISLFVSDNSIFNNILLNLS